MGKLMIFDRWWCHDAENWGDRMIPGIDVSHWQHDINWSEVKRSGVQFAFIKATEFPDRKTTLFVSPKMRENINGAGGNGIHWGAYHFFRTHIDPILQAQAFCETVGYFPSMPPVCDLEAAGSKGERLNLKVRLFLDEVERITHRKPIIYTSGGFWRSYMAYEKSAHTDWARQYSLWIAQYTNMWPSPLYPWAGWEFWQYSNKGRIPGIQTDVDLNWFNGSMKDLEQRFLPLMGSANAHETTNAKGDDYAGFYPEECPREVEVVEQQLPETTVLDSSIYEGIGYNPGVSEKPSIGLPENEGWIHTHYFRKGF